MKILSQKYRLINYVFVLLLVVSICFLRFIYADEMADDDVISPIMSGVSVIKGTYSPGTTISFNLMFSEDVVIKKNNSDETASITFDIDNPTLEGIKYSFTIDAGTSVVSVKKDAGIYCNYPVNGSEVIIDQDIVSHISNIQFNNLTVYDHLSLDEGGNLVGNELNMSVIPKIYKICDITTWNGPKGIVSFGRFPQLRITDENLVTKLNGLKIKDGQTFDYKGETYLLEDGDFYRYQGIKWRVLKNDGIVLTLLADSVIEGRQYGNLVPNSAKWSYETDENEPITDSNLFISDKIGNHIRTYLNSTYIGDTFRNTGFVYKAFNEEERNYLLRTLTKSKYKDDLDLLENQGEDVYDKVSLLSYEEFMDNDFGGSSYGFLNEGTRVSYVTHYGSLGNISIGGESNISSYWLRSVGNEGNNRNVLVDNDGNIILNGVPNNLFYGIRPLIRIPANIFKYGEGNSDVPYSIVPISDYEISNYIDSELSNDNAYNSEYVRVGSKIKIDAYFTKKLKYAPKFTIMGVSINSSNIVEELDVEYNGETACKYSAEYIVDGSENLNENDKVKILISDIVDESGLELSNVIPSVSSTLIYDVTSPKVKKVNAVVGEYDEIYNNEINVMMKFSEDVDILYPEYEQGVSPEGRFFIHMIDTTTGNKYYGLKYTYINNSDKLEVKKEDKIDLVYSLDLLDEIKIGFNDNFHLLINSLNPNEGAVCENIIIKDQAGNEIVWNENNGVPMNGVLDFEIFDEGSKNGYIYLGSYPADLVRDADLVQELNKQKIDDGKTFVYNSEQYLFERNNYYRYRPILWRIVENNGEYIKLITDKIIEKISGNVDKWSIDTLQIPFNSAISQGKLRQYLNNYYVGTTFDTSGFLSKAFSTKEIEQLVLTENNKDDKVNRLLSYFTVDSYDKFDTYYDDNVATEDLVYLPMASKIEDYHLSREIGYPNISTDYAGANAWYFSSRTGIVKEWYNPAYVTGANIFAYHNTNQNNVKFGRYKSNETSYGSYVIGIRPMITLNVNTHFLVGDGSRENPYAFEFLDKNPPEIISQTVTYNCPTERKDDYIVSNTEVEFKFEVNEELSKKPEVYFSGIKLIAEKEAATNIYSVKYKFDSNSDLGDYEKLNIVVKNLIDLSGNIANPITADESDKVKFDMINPEIENVVTFEKSLNKDNELILKLTFSEDVLITNVDDSLDGFMKMTLSNDFSNLEVKYEKEASESKLITKGTWIDYKCILTNPLEIDITNFDVDKKLSLANCYSNLIVTDLAGNELVLDKETKFEIIKDVKLNDFVEVGYFPDTKVISEDLIAEFNSLALNSGSKFTYGREDYVVTDYGYYKIAPIVWRVVKNDLVNITLESNKAIDNVHSVNNNFWGNYDASVEVKSRYITDYLNSEVEDTLYVKSGFLGKAFTYDEKNKMTKVDGKLYVDVPYDLNRYDGENYSSSEGYQKYTYVTQYAARHNGGTTAYYVSKSGSSTRYTDQNTYGIKADICIPLKNILYGDGTSGKAYSFYNNDTRAPEVVNTEMINENRIEGYISRGSKITYKVTFNEELLDAPIFKAGSKTLKMTKSLVEENTYTVEYTINGNEGLKDGETLILYITKCTDLAGNTLEKYETPVSDRLIYDVSAPSTKFAYTLCGTYQKNSEDINIKVKFNEDISIIASEDAIITGTLRKDDTNIKEFNYAVSMDSPINISTEENLEFTSEMTEAENIELIAGDSGYTFEFSYDTNKISIIDLSGNLCTYLGDRIDVAINKNITRWKDGNGYVEFGKIAQSLVTNKDMIKEFNAYNLESGSIFTYSAQEFLFENMNYYKVEPVIWLVVNNDGEKVTLFSKDVIDKRNITTAGYWNMNKELYPDVPITTLTSATVDSADIRAWLNSNYNDNKYSKIGFLSKMFNEREIEKIQVVNDYKEDLSLKDMIYLPSKDDYNLLYDKALYDSPVTFSEYTNGVRYFMTKTYSTGQYWTGARYIPDKYYWVNSDKYIGVPTDGVIGIRPMLNLKTNDLLYGSGTLDDPYMIYENDTKVPQIVNLEVINDNDKEGYIRKGTKVTYKVEFNEDLLKAPYIKFMNKTLYMNKVTEDEKVKYVVTYEVTENEGLKEGEKVYAALIKYADTNGNMVDLNEDERICNVLKYDVVVPHIDSAVVKAYDYEAGDTFELDMNFTEDIVIDKTGDSPSITLNLVNEDNIDGMPDMIENLTYTFVPDELDSNQIIIPKGKTIKFIKQVVEPFNLDINSEDDMIIKAITLNNVRICDYAGNDVIITSVPSLKKKLDIYKWDGTKGYVKFGRYPQELLTDESIISELNKCQIGNNEVYNFKGKEYLYLDGKYYVISDILWKIIYTDTTDIIIMTDKIICNEKKDIAEWNREYFTYPLPNVISNGKTYRTYLNSEVTSREFTKRGFLGAAFDSTEKSFIQDSNTYGTYVDEKGVEREYIDKVYLLKYSQYVDPNYAFSMPNLADTSHTDYAKRTNYYVDYEKAWRLSDFEIYQAPNGAHYRSIIMFYNASYNEYLRNYVDTFNYTDNADRNANVNLRPVIKLKLDIFKKGDGTLENPFIIMNTGSLPKITSAELTTNNSSNLYAKAGNKITATVTFDQYLGDVPSIKILGREAMITKSIGTTYVANYTLDGTENQGEGQPIVLSVSNISNTRGYLAEDVDNVPVKKVLYYDCTVPIIENLDAMPDIYKEDDEVPFSITFSEPLNISLVPASEHYIKIGFKELNGRGPKFIVDSDSMNVTSLTGEYKVLEEDYTLGLTVGSIEVNGLRIRDAATNYLDETFMPELVSRVIMTSKDVKANIIADVGESTYESLITYTIDFGRNVMGFTSSDIHVINGRITKFEEKNNGLYTYYVVQVQTINRGITQKLIVPENSCYDEVFVKNKESSIEVKIFKVDISDQIGVFNLNYVYDKTPKSVIATGIDDYEYVVYYEGIEGTEYLRQISAPINAGKYKVTIEIADSEPINTGSKSYVMTIEKKEVETQIFVNDKEVDINDDGETTKASVVITLLDSSDLCEGDILDFIYDTANFQDTVEGTDKIVEVYGITSTNSNYKVKTVNKNALGNIIQKGEGIQIDNVEYTYDGTNKTVEPVLFREDATTSCEIKKDNINVYEMKDAGIYHITTKMYVGGVLRSRKVTKLIINPLELELEFDAKNKVYDGNTNCDVKVRAKNIVGSDVCNINITSATFDSKDIGINKEIMISGLTIDNSNYKLSKDYGISYASISPKGKLSNEIVANPMNYNKEVYKDTPISLSYNGSEGVSEGKKVTLYYEINEDGNLKQYVSDFIMDKDFQVKVKASLEGYEDSNFVTYTFILRDVNQILMDINDENVTVLDIRDILVNEKDIELLEIPTDILTNFNALTEDSKNNLVNELIKHKYMTKEEFANRILYELSVFDFESKLRDILIIDEFTGHEENAIVLAKKIENSKLDYEKLTKEIKNSISEELVDKLNKLYDDVINYYQYENKVTIDGNENSIFGLIGKFDSTASKLYLEMDSNDEVHQELVDNYPMLDVYKVYDIKVREGEEEEEHKDNTYVQPKENEKVLVKLEVPKSYSNKKFRIYHLKNDKKLNEENEIISYWTEQTIIDSETKFFVLFETDSFSDYAIVLEEYYNITLNSNDGGTVTTSIMSDKVIKGAGFTVNINAIAGYIIKELKINGEVKKLNTLDSAMYAINNVSSDINVNVTFMLKTDFIKDASETKPTSEESSGGRGRGKDETIYEITEKLEEINHNAYMFGYKDNTFKPTGAMTRAEAAAIFARISNDFSEAKVYNSNFKDVPKESWYYKSLSYCYEKEYMSGYKNGKFNPNANITRCEFITVLAKVSNIDIVDGHSKLFKEINGLWFEKYVVSLEKFGILKGIQDGTFGAYNDVTRAEVCRMINPILDRAPDKANILNKNINTNITDINKNSWYYCDVIEAITNHTQLDY